MEVQPRTDIAHMHVVLCAVTCASWSARLGGRLLPHFLSVHTVALLLSCLSFDFVIRGICWDIVDVALPDLPGCLSMAAFPSAEITLTKCLSSWHDFPEIAARKKSWLTVHIKRNENTSVLEDHPEYFKVGRSTKVCGAHFRPEDISDGTLVRKKGKKKTSRTFTCLKRGAVPSIHGLQLHC